MRKRDFVYILIILACGILIYYLYSKKPGIQVIPDIREDLEKIDSLRHKIVKDSLRIDSLEKIKPKIVERVIVRVKEQKLLPPDSAIIIFHENTEKYGELHSKIPILSDDSSIVCTADNIRDANIIAVKYEGEMEINEVLEEMVAIERVVNAKKDSIISEKSIILDKTITAYNKSIIDLTADLKKERRKKKLAVTLGGITAGILSGLLIAK